MPIKNNKHNLFRPTMEKICDISRTNKNKNRIKKYSSELHPNNNLYIVPSSRIVIKKNNNEELSIKNY